MRFILNRFRMRQKSPDEKKIVRLEFPAEQKKDYKEKLGQTRRKREKGGIHESGRHVSNQVYRGEPLNVCELIKNDPDAA